MKPKLRRIALTALILALPLVALSAVHIVFSLAAQAEIDRRGVPAKYHNAMKHAYAAAEFYSLARPVLGPVRSQSLVMRLGEINEWIERYFKHDTDVTAEVYKDQRNNLAGIAAAEFLYAREGYVSPCMRLRLIGRLAEDGDLAAYAEDRRIPPLPAGYDTAAALRRMEQDEAALRRTFDAALEARSTALRADVGLD